MTRVMIFGSFDGLHPGHEYLLTKAKEYGEELWVSLAQDDVIQRLKGRQPQYTFSQRREALLHSGFVDEVVPGDPVEGEYHCVLAQKPDVIAFGYDQDALRGNFLAWKAKTGYSVKVLVLSAFEPDKHKSSLLRGLL